MTSQGTRTGVPKPKAIWHKNIVYKFCDICIRGIEKLFRPQTHFTKEGWIFIVNEFQKEAGLPYTQKQLKNKWDSMKKEYKLWKDMMHNETGLGWDTNRNTIDADDAWWEEKIKENPAYANFRLSGVDPQLEEKYEVMFSPIIATGEFAISPGCDNVPPQEEQRGDSEEEIQFEDSLDEMFEGRSTPTGGASNKKRSASIPLKKGKRQAGVAERLAKQIDTLVSALASKSSTTNSSRVVHSGDSNYRSVLADLKTLPGIDMKSEMFMYAIELLEDKLKRDAYLELETPELKLIWITYNFDKLAKKNV